MITLSVALFCAVLCLLPVFLLDILPKYTVEDLSFAKAPSSLMNFRTSLSASLFIVIVPFIDILFDITSSIMATFLLKKKNKTDGAMAPTETERLFIILGMAVQSTIAFLPSSIDEPTFGLIYSCTNYSSTILVLTPVIVYLNRITTTFNCFVLVSSQTCFLVSQVLFSFSFFFNSHPHVFEKMDNTGTILILLAIISIISATLISIYKFLSAKIGTEYARESWIRDMRNLRYLNIINSPEIFATYIPALHIVASLIIIAANVWIGVIPNNANIMNYNSKHILVISVETILLVTEFRIRKCEMENGLIALIESKKTYVRYISHELRTPLSTVALGLQLLTEQMKKGKEAVDVERYDTLCDVNVSCEAAVDILNDLLCYEKLESGFLDLHPQNIPVIPFLSETVEMFALQARDSGISMNLILEIEPTLENIQVKGRGDEDPATALSLNPSDTVFMDKFKMDQVLRNLLSNALKFTPKGGAIKIEAKFIEKKESRKRKSTLFRAALNSVLPLSDSLEDISLRKKSASVDRKKSVIESGALLMSSIMRKGKSARIALDEESGAPGSIDTNIDRKAVEGKLLVKVSDTGHGISKENQSKIFKEIVQFHPEILQAGGGSGLGLWIVKNIIDLHKGDISVSSAGEGFGTCFTFEVSMIRHSYSELGVANSTVNSYTPDAGVAVNKTYCKANRKQKADVSRDYEFSELIEQDFNTQMPLINAMNILIVDDSKMNRKMVSKFLKGDDYLCDEAVDGLEAIKMVKENLAKVERNEIRKPYHAILMDYMMPLCNGPMATRKIREMGFTGLIFGLTGNGLQGDIEHFETCGANRVFIKPLDIELFNKAIIGNINQSLSGKYGSVCSP